MDEEKEVKVKKTNAENNKVYRERKREEINARRREQRNNKKAIQMPKIVYEVKELKKIVKLPERGQVIDIAEATKSKYKGYIRNFYKRYTGEELNEDEDIILKINGEKYKALNISKKFKILINKNIEIIKGSSTDTSNIYSIFRGIRGFTYIAKVLYPYLKDYAEQYDEKRSEIIAEKEDLEISFEKKDIIENIKKIEGEEDKIIYGYLMLMNGRVHDLRYTKIANDKEETKDEGHNYIYEGKYYINNTKNKKKKVLDISEEFAELYKGRGVGYLLGRLMASSTIAKRIENITNRVYGKIYTSSNLRHIKATQINERGTDYKGRKEIAERAGHSVEQQIKYSYKVKGDNKGEI
jgi:hypothetical protein